MGMKFPNKNDEIGINFGERDYAKQTDMVKSVEIDRKIDYILSASPWWVNRNKDDITQDVTDYLSMGVDNLTICCHIIENNGEMEFSETLENIIFGIDYALKKGLGISAIKMHCKYEVFTSVENSYDKYKSIVSDIANAVKDRGIKYFTFLNEIPEIYNSNNQNEILLVSELSTSLKNLGFLVGVTCANRYELLKFETECDWILPHIDIFCLNFYNKLGYNGSKITKEDSVLAWENTNRAMLRIRENFPDKPFIISESGTQHYWECLINPAIANWQDYYELTNGYGDVATIYFHGLFENESYNANLTELWIWYPEQMKYDNFYELIRKTTRNEVCDG